MENITVVIKTPDNKLCTFCVGKHYLDRLVTNLDLYQKNMNFINSYIEDCGEDGCNGFVPTSEGIIFIDMINNIILDSQGTTGINKITTTEIKMSKNGKIPDETESNSIFHRFIRLLEAKYLKGFDEWRDNGHHLNTNVTRLSYDALMDYVLESNYSYGQFVFLTTPFKVEMFSEVDWEEQTKLFNRASELELIPKEKYEGWKYYLDGLK